MKPNSARRNLLVLALIVFVDNAGIGLIIPVMPSLIMSLSTRGIDRAAEIGGWLLFSYAMMQFVFAPVIGGLSDRFGRRPVLLVTLAALGIDYALMAWAPTLIWLFVGRLISGVMGAAWAAANSCIADSVPGDRRGAAFGMLGGAGAAGFVFGPAIGGLAGQHGVRLPFVAAALLCAAGALFGFFFFRETLAPERRRPFDFRRANPFGSMMQMARRPLVLGCLLTIFFMQLAAQAQFSVGAFYGELKYGWTTFYVGVVLTYFGVMLALWQGLMSGKAIAAFGAPRTAQIALIFAAPALLAIGLAPTTWMVLVAMAFGAVSGMCFPALQQMMSRDVPDNAQGELQGAIASTVSLTAIIGPPLMTNIFGAYADERGAYFPGAPFVVGSAVLLLALTALFWATRHARPALPARV